MTFFDYTDSEPVLVLVNTEADLKSGLEKSTDALIEKIESRVSKYKSEVARLGAIHKRTGSEEYDLRMHTHFLGENESLLKEVREYRSSGINRDCRQSGWTRLFGIGEIRKLDVIALKFGALNADICDDLVNKFASLPVPEYEKLRDLYVLDRHQFFEKMHRILRENLLAEMVKLVKRHHLLVRRVEYIEDAINLYREGRYQSASLILVSQIEGLLEDCLCDMGCDRLGFESQTVGSKAESISGVLRTFVGVDYYKFRLPILRNELAHGRILPGDKMKEYATSIALDAWGLFNQVVSSRSLKTNQLVEKIKEKSIRTGVERRMLSIEYADLYRKEPVVALPKFYGLDEDENELLKLAREAETWDALAARCENEEELSRYFEIGKFIKSEWGGDETIVNNFKTKAVNKLREKKQKLQESIAKIQHALGIGIVGDGQP